jgi:hypothetical protein
VTQVVNGASGALEFTGFFAPIDMPSGGAVVWNSARAGQAIPLKWQVMRGGQPVADPSTFVRVLSNQVRCDAASENTSAIEESAAGGSGLQYFGDGQWQFNWATARGYANTCRVMFVKFSDGTTSPVAYFRFR